MYPGAGDAADETRGTAMEKTRQYPVIMEEDMMVNEQRLLEEFLELVQIDSETKFEKEPERYTGETPPPPAAPLPEDTIYTGPMDPEIRQIGPGTCLICGMALEPDMPSAENGPNPEYVDFVRRLTLAGPLVVPIVILEMGGHVGAFDWLSPFISGLIQLAFSLPIVLWAGRPFFERGWLSVKTRHLNMFTLIALGTGVAFAYSLVALFAPNLFPHAFHHHDGSVPIYFEAASMIIVLVLVGQVLELRAREQTGGAIRALLDLAPATARRLRADDSEDEIALDLARIGDRLRVRPGDKVPLDGVVLEGRSYVDESMLTGESDAVARDVGEQVLSGAFCVTGSGARPAARGPFQSAARRQASVSTIRPIRSISPHSSARTRNSSPVRPCMTSRGHRTEASTPTTSPAATATTAEAGRLIT